MIDPDMLLRNFRNAMMLGHTSIAALSMSTLDEQLSAGGAFPEAWARHHREVEAEL